MTDKKIVVSPLLLTYGDGTGYVLRYLEKKRFLYIFKIWWVQETVSTKQVLVSAEAIRSYARTLVPGWETAPVKVKRFTFNPHYEALHFRE